MNKVLESIHDDTVNRCVDLFVRDDGTYGFEEFRRDAEDGGTWQSLQRYSRMQYQSLGEARSQARSEVSWLAEIGE